MLHMIFIAAVMTVSVEGLVAQDVGIFEKQEECEKARTELIERLSTNSDVQAYVVSSCTKSQLIVKDPPGTTASDNRIELEKQGNVKVK